MRSVKFLSLVEIVSFKLLSLLWSTEYRRNSRAGRDSWSAVTGRRISFPKRALSDKGSSRFASACETGGGGGGAVRCWSSGKIGGAVVLESGELSNSTLTETPGGEP